MHAIARPTALASLFSALCAIQLPAPAQELDPAWEVTVDSAVEIAGDALEVVAAGDVVVAGSLQQDDELVLLRAFDGDGSPLWEQSLPVGVPHPLEDLELSADGSTLYSLYQRPGDRPRFELRTVDAQTGVEGWSRTFTFDGSADSRRGSLAAEGGRVAALIDRTFESGPNSSRVRTLSDVDGSDIATSAAFDFALTRLAFSPSGATAVLFERDGSMAAIDAGTGGTLWAVDPPTTPSPLPLGSGVTEIVWDASETVLARTDGAATVAYDAGTGSEIWSQSALEARDVIPYGADRFFVVGQQGLGSTQTGATLEVGMLDAATGAVLWSKTESSLSLSSSALFVQVTHAAADLSRDRVAMRNKGLWVYDAATGAGFGFNSFTGSSGSNSPLFSLDDGTWVGGNGNTLAFSDARIVEAFDDQVQFEWFVKAFDEEIAPTRPALLRHVEGTNLVHLLWEYDPQISLFPSSGTWEVRDATDGALLASWPTPFWSPQTGVELDPGGLRVATIRDSCCSSPSIFVDVYDALTGASIGEVELNEDIFGNERDVAWSLDGSRFTCAWVNSNGLRAGGFLANGQLAWTQTVSIPGAANIGEPTVGYDAATGDILVSVDFRVGGDQALAVTRLGAQGGAQLGQLIWDGDGPASTVPDSDVVGFVTDAATALTYLTVEVGQNGFEDEVTVIAIDAATMTVTAEHTVAPAGVTVKYGTGGTALIPDDSALIVVGTAPLAPPNPTAGVQIDVLELPDLTPRFTAQRATNNSFNGLQVDVVNREVAALRNGIGNFFPLDNAQLEVFDLSDGDTLAEVDESDGVLTSSVLAAVDDRIVMFGQPVGDSDTTVVQGWAVAPLLSGPDSIPVAGGSVDFLLDVGTERAGDPYLVVGSITGTEPGTPVGSVVVPIVVDGYTQMTLLSASTGPFVNTSGLVDGDGLARARIDVPTQPGLVGTTVFHAAVLFESGGSVDFTTQPVQFDILP